MKYSLECQVTSNISINQKYSYIQGDKEFIFSPNEQGILSSIKIIVKVQNPENFFSVINEKPKSITINADRKITEEIISDFQYLEGHIALVAGMKKINWDEPMREWLPETEEEKQRTKLFSAHFSRENPKKTTEIDQNLLQEIISDKSVLEDLTVLLSFYREGRLFFERKEYINAFYDFYFILEDLFGGGSWHNWQVKTNFIASKELQDTIRWALSTLNEANKKEIGSLLNEKSFQYTVEGIVNLLVEMRGNLHHFSRINSASKKPSPLLHQNYESLAFLAMAIAMQSILKERSKLKTDKEQNLS